MDFLIGFLSLISLLVTVQGECFGEADLVIAIPGSYAVPYADFTPFEEHIVELLRYFSIEPDQFNIGLVLYGEHTVTIATPQPFKTRVQMNTRVSLMANRDIHVIKMGRKQNLAKAIREIRHILTKPPDGYDLNILRPYARKIGVVFAYGPTPPDEIQNVITAATKAKNEDGILMYALIANGSAEDFPLIGTDYCRLFSMLDFKSKLVDAIQDLAYGICSSLSPIPMINSTNCFPGTYRKSRKIAVTCQVEDNMVQPDPNNCHYYYRCAYFDTSPIKFSCPGDTLYDPISGICNMKTNVACYNDLVCPTDRPMLHPHPLDCSKFVNCYNDFIPHVQTCPRGQVFDLLHQSCNMTTFGACITPLNHIEPVTPAPAIAPPVLPNNNLFGLNDLAINPNNNLLGLNNAIQPNDNLLGLGNNAIQPNDNLLGLGNHAIKPNENLLGIGNNVIQPNNNLLGLGNIDSVVGQNNNMFGIDNNRQGQGPVIQPNNNRVRPNKERERFNFNRGRQHNSRDRFNNNRVRPNNNRVRPNNNRARPNNNFRLK